jgi:hypothetical protein
LAVDRVVELDINIARYQPFCGGPILTSLQPSKAERQSSISRTMTTTVSGGPSLPADTLKKHYSQTEKQKKKMLEAII